MHRLLLLLAVLATSQVVTAAESPLKADGTTLRDAQGRAVQLRGVNIGGWLEWQAWMCPMDTSKALQDLNPGHNGYDFEVRRLLTRRFGAKAADELIDTWYDSWITERDLDNIKALGLNAARLTVGYDTLLDEDGNWRANAFGRMDWFVSQAWRRGIYTILDLHAFLPPGANQDGSADGYWASEAQKAETLRLWTRIAEHYRGNPAVAMYDLLNEPNNSQLKGHQPPSSATVRDLYDRLYQALRAVDPDHAVAMEGVWGWQTLRDPAKAGYQNVVYSFHWYNWGAKTTADRQRGTDAELGGIAKMRQAWPVPVLIGEFNHFGDQEAWKYALAEYDRHGLSWTLWTYKNKASGSNSWGVYTTRPGKAPAKPNLAEDSADQIREKWGAWSTTDETFALNPLLAPVIQATRGTTAP